MLLQAMKTFKVFTESNELKSSRSNKKAFIEQMMVHFREKLATT
jgi:hypothetical protein